MCYHEMQLNWHITTLIPSPRTNRQCDDDSAPKIGLVEHPFCTVVDVVRRRCARQVTGGFWPPGRTHSRAALYPLPSAGEQEVGVLTGNVRGSEEQRLRRSRRSRRKLSDRIGNSQRWRKAADAEGGLAAFK